MDHTVLPANYTMPAFTPQPQNITLWPNTGFQSKERNGGGLYLPITSMLPFAMHGDCTA